MIHDDTFRYDTVRYACMRLAGSSLCARASRAAAREPRPVAVELWHVCRGVRRNPMHSARRQRSDFRVRESREIVARVTASAVSITADQIVRRQIRGSTGGCDPPASQSAAPSTLTIRPCAPHQHSAPYRGTRRPAGLPRRACCTPLCRRCCMRAQRRSRCHSPPCPRT